jgi:hypothetical protein
MRKKKCREVDPGCASLFGSLAEIASLKTLADTRYDIVSEFGDFITAVTGPETLWPHGRACVTSARKGGRRACGRLRGE